jgi:predicted nuclease of restriction endonuclease-like (RecB) superfamily
MSKKRSKAESLARKTAADAAPVTGYDEFLLDLKSRIQSAQVKAAISISRELITLYWNIGREILQRQTAQGWGAKVIDRLARDLHAAFRDMKGFSPRNIKYMRAFADAYAEEQFVQQVAAQIPWFHHCVLLDKVKDSAERVWYIRQTVENGWSRNVLVLQIESGLYRRKGKAITNFDRTLPAPQSDLAQQLLKDPYNFDFLTLDTEARERDLERGLLTHIRQFLLELGVGFAFVGSQYHLEVGGDDFYIDLLFYHLQLRCFVVIDLKMRKFMPADAGQMNFYLSAVDDLIRPARCEQAHRRLGLSNHRVTA